MALGTILVTGGAGFIGSHLVEELLHQNHSVRVLDNYLTGKEENLTRYASRIEIYPASVTDADAVREAVRGCDLIYHLAALPSVSQSVEDPISSHEITATGTVLVLDEARRAGVRRLVFAGSSSAYGDQPGESRGEHDLLQPLSPYAAAKLASEHYCQAFTAVYGLETVRLRFFNVFGPRQDAKSPYSGVIALFLDAMTQGRAPTIFGDGLQARDFVYIQNVVQALIQAGRAARASGRVYNIGMGQSITIRQLVDTLNDLLGTRIEPIYQPARAGDIRLSQADIRRAQEDLDYRPTISFREGLKRTLEWFSK